MPRSSSASSYFCKWKLKLALLKYSAAQWGQSSIAREKSFSASSYFFNTEFVTARFMRAYSFSGLNFKAVEK